jgi:hypothetical protein
MGKKEKVKQEKPLEKMTSKELKEVALTIPDISGVHGMNKQELISVIKEFRGIVEDVPTKEITGMRELKKKIAALREKKNEAKSAGDRKHAQAFRKKMNRLKKRTRRAA